MCFATRALVDPPLEECAFVVEGTLPLSGGSDPPRKAKPMVTGIVIPHETRIRVFKHQLSALEDYQAAVGGYIEPIYVAAAHLTIFANEEGKVRQLPVNRRATCMWWMLNPDMHGADVLVGDVVLCGSKRGHGSSTELPADLAKLILDTDRFRVEVRTVGDPEHWYEDGSYFEDYFEAAIVAINLQERWTQICEVRVSAA